MFVVCGDTEVRLLVGGPAWGERGAGAEGEEGRMEEQGCKEELEGQGFIVLRQFLKKEEVEEVKAHLDRS